ncbi:MAG: hypothetical protein AcusKO_21470 [Acuticoccus sp.]
MTNLGVRLAAAGAVVLAMAVAASAQAPTAAQKEALRSNCGGDFQSHCAGVTPGGMDALMCLEKNEASLSAGCQSAVDAIKGGSSSAGASSAATAPASQPAAAGAAPAKAASAPAAKPAPAAPAAGASAPAMNLRQEMRLVAASCFVDFRSFCPNLPVGRGNMIGCLKRNESKLAPACHAALSKANAL